MPTYTATGRIGVLVEVNIETDFAAKNEEFRQFVKDIAMQIAAAKPEYVRREEVPADVIEKEMNILRAQARNEGKPEKVVEKMVEGRIEKYFKEVMPVRAALDQGDPDKTIKDLVMLKR